LRVPERGLLSKPTSA